MPVEIRTVLPVGDFAAVRYVVRPPRSARATGLGHSDSVGASTEVHADLRLAIQAARRVLGDSDGGIVVHAMCVAHSHIVIAAERRPRARDVVARLDEVAELTLLAGDIDWITGFQLGKAQSALMPRSRPCPHPYEGTRREYFLALPTYVFVRRSLAELELDVMRDRLARTATLVRDEMFHADRFGVADWVIDWSTLRLVNDGAPHEPP